MGNGGSRYLVGCFRCSAASGGGDHIPGLGPLDETLGHSFCYSADDSGPAAFRLISGASVSANSSAPVPIYDNATSSASAVSRSHFQSSSSFSAIPLQLAGAGGGSATADRGFFLSGPIERGNSGPLESFSGPLVKRSRKGGISGRMKRVSLLRRSISERNRPWVVPLRSLPRKKCEDFHGGDGDIGGGNVQWAHGKAGEDRVHVVVSEEHRWLFVGIYDGFNGPEAPEFLVDNLYKAVYGELKGLFWEEDEEEETEEQEGVALRKLWEFLAEGDEDGGLEFSGSGRFVYPLSRLRRSRLGSWRKEEKLKVVQEVDRGKVTRRRRRKAVPIANHESVLRALEKALTVTENAYLEMTDRVLDCNPELALMGSCLLVVLMRDEDVYVMNLGDSRAIVAQHKKISSSGGESSEGIDRVGEDVDRVEVEAVAVKSAVDLTALQLSTDHSTSIKEVSVC